MAFRGSFDLLPGPPPSAFFSGRDDQRTAEFDDAYLRAIGKLPPVRFASIPAHHAAALHDSIELPATCELYAAALDFSAHLSYPAVEVTDFESSTRLSDYDADIDVNLRKMELDVKQRPSPGYLDTLLGDLKSQSTRARLIFWMEDVAHHFRLAAGTLQRAVSYVDRVLSERTLWLTDTQMEYALHLLGATAVYTAAKYEEHCTISKVNAAGIAKSCGFATGLEVIDMEFDMVAALGYDLSGPTAYTFVHHFTRHDKGGEQDLEVQRLAHLFAKQSTLDYRWVRHPPSALAASAVFLAKLILNPVASQVPQWNADFEELTGYKPTDLTLEIQTMHRMNPDPRFRALPAFLHDE
jgi:cyclin A